MSNLSQNIYSKLYNYIANPLVGPPVVPENAEVNYQFNLTYPDRAILEQVNQLTSLSTTRAANKNVEQTNGALVTVGANTAGLTGSSVSIEGAATNLLANPAMTGGGAAPTSWTQPIGTGSSTPVASSLNSSLVEYLQVATAERPYLAQGSISVLANNDYILFMKVTSVSGGLLANETLSIASPPAGSFLSYPICSANPLGGGASAITTGILCMTLSVAGTAGSVLALCGIIGGAGGATGSLQFAIPNFTGGLYHSSPIFSETTRDKDVSILSTYLNGVSGDQWPANDFTRPFRFQFRGISSATAGLFSLYSDANNEFTAFMTLASPKIITLRHRVAGTTKDVVITFTDDIAFDDWITITPEMDSSSGCTLTAYNETAGETKTATDATATADIAMPTTCMLGKSNAGDHVNINLASDTTSNG